ncbi:sensor domain-containing diguanylate cyclase [Pseudoalteromonas pernae]|uniref:sensor domain-containing diguanylate cyclase n=1 Tax=Pseudoalteromonas pernae TaxID=3118054 RepID=UPI003242C724
MPHSGESKRTTSIAKNSFRHRLLRRILLAIVLVFGLGGILVHQVLYDELKSQKIKDLEQTTHVLNGLIESSVQVSVESYLKGVSESSIQVVERIFKRYTEGELSQSDAKALTASYIASLEFEHSGYLVAIDCTDADRPVLVAHPNSSLIGADNSRFPFMVEECAIKNGFYEFQVELPKFGVVDKSIWLTEFAPWNWVIGVSPFKHEYDQLYSFEAVKRALDELQLNAGFTPYVIDIDGTFVVHSQLQGHSAFAIKDAQTGKSVIAQPLETLKRAIAQNNKDDFRGITTYTLQHSDKESLSRHIASYQYIEATGWIIVLSTQMASIDEGMLHFTYLHAASIVISLFICYFIISQTISPKLQAVADLTNEVENIAKGHYDVRLPVHREGEIGRLSIAIENMAQEIQDHTASLEQTVNERTQQLKAANKKLELIAHTDALTGVANRRKFDAFFDAQIAHSAQSHQPFTLILCDIDYFKQFNDLYGHDEGDACLRKVAQLLEHTVAQCSAHSKLVARYGGEEFAVILTDLENSRVQELVSDLLRKVVELNIDHHASKYQQVTISLGIVCTVPDESTVARDVFVRADKALYISKKTGRNKASFDE